MTRILLFILAALFLPSLPAAAQEKTPPPSQQLYKDSLDYTMDDGVMSEEEMMAEAQQMYQLCDMNVYQKVYFNCECIAGAFLQQREKLGPLVTQDEIFSTITNSAQVSPSCANTEFIAGRAYQSCINFRTGYSRTELSEDNGDYCSCVANKMANDFGTAPRLSSQYVETLRFNAMEACEDKAKRTQVLAVAAKARKDAEEEFKARMEREKTSEAETNPSAIPAITP